MSWIALVLAGILEIAWAVGLKFTQGFTKLWPSVGTVLAMIISFKLLSFAMEKIPIGTAYAVWTGIGAAGTALVGMLFLGEPRTTARAVCIALIVAGVLGLKVFSQDSATH